MRCYRILTNGSKYKVEIEKWFLVWYWETAQRVDFSIDGCGSGYSDAIFNDLDSAKLFGENLKNKTWIVKHGPYII